LDKVFDPYAVAMEAPALFAPTLNDNIRAKTDINRISIGF